ncbi:hypothetical protein [Stutzerimonas stutzeri]|uniref:hypothetical protein n=1 Tax=Stutzerimonas stutzeri TaxID=316 RepID=UPI0004B00F5B|nr:hypothetical protein [Stutzerimonas stutzeri]MCQ4331685.1 hypothetical protein [Stutzerimonas stutzeri]
MTGESIHWELPKPLVVFQSTTSSGHRSGPVHRPVSHYFAGLDAASDPRTRR